MGIEPLLSLSSPSGRATCRTRVAMPGWLLPSPAPTLAETTRDVQIKCAGSSRMGGVHGELLTRGSTASDSRSCYDDEMRDLVILFVHVIATLTRLLGPGVLPQSTVKEYSACRKRNLLLECAS